MKKIIRAAIRLAILLIIVALAFSFIQRFNLKKVVVISSFRYDLKMSALNSKNLLFLDSDLIAKWIRENNQLLKGISMSKKYPDTILIQPEFRVAVAYVMSSDGPLYVDSSGVFLKDDGRIEKDLPFIEIPEFIVSDKMSDWRLSKTLEYITELSKKDIKVKSVIFQPQDSTYYLHIDGDNQVIVRQEDYPASIAASLQTIIARFRIEGKNISRIDFRFEKPLVVLHNE